MAALPDVPSDDEWDKIDFSILKTGNFEGGWIAEFYARRKAKEDAEEAQWRKEEQDKMNREDEDLFKKIMENLREPASDEELPVTKAAVPPKQQIGAPGTITSRSAVSALARPAKTAAATPSYAAPTAATKAKAPSSTVLGHKKTGSLSNMPSGNGRAASYNTLGYAKGRAVSNTLRHQPLNVAFKDEPAQTKPKKKDSLRELEEMVLAKEYEEAGIRMDDLDDFSLGGVPLPTADNDDEEGMFQFKIPRA